MTTVPLTAPGGENEALEAVPDEGSAPSGGPGEVRGISDLAQRIVTVTYLGHPRLHRALVIVIIVLVVTCLIATGTRLSFLPLLPIPLLGIGAYALRRIRATKDDHRLLLAWTGLFLIATLLGFWLMSVVARWVE
jgi:hypothetical protein